MAMCEFLQEADSETEMSMREVWGVLSGITPARSQGIRMGQQSEAALPSVACGSQEGLCS